MLCFINVDQLAMQDDLDDGNTRYIVKLTAVSVNKAHELSSMNLHCTSYLRCQRCNYTSGKIIGHLFNGILLRRHRACYSHCLKFFVD